LASPLIFVSISVAAVSWASDLGFDGLLTWGFKGKLAFMEGGWPAAYFVDPWRVLSHLDYPLLIPTIEAWIYTFLGGVDEQAVKILFILFYFGLLALFYGFLRPYFHAPMCILYTTLLATTPYLASLAAVSGYVDVPLMVYLLATAVFLHRWLKDGQESDLLLTAVLGSFAVWVKREAAVYWLFNAFAITAYVLLWRHKTYSWKVKGKSLFLFFAPAAIILLPWFAFLAWLDVPNSDFNNIGLTVLWDQADRLRIIAQMVISQYLSLGRWGIAWIIWGIVVVWRWRQFAHPATLYLWGVTIFPIVGLSFTFVFSVWEPFTLHIDLSLERLLLHALPMAWYFVAIQTVGLEAWLARQVVAGPAQVTGEENSL
jgi:hypothetical protein